jgi:phosphate uptake regulator
MMFADRTTKKWHKSIIADAEKKLGRKLTDNETAFITSRLGFIALEMIHDTIKALTGKDLEDYLNSESVK